MDTEAKILLTIAFIIFTGMSSCTYGINYHDNETMLNMIKSGSTAAEARCAVKGSSSNVCAILAAKTKTHDE